MISNIILIFLPLAFVDGQSLSSVNIMKYMGDFYICMQLYLPI
jgi:hypothetical protein